MELKGKDSIDLGTLNVYRLFSKYFFPTLLGMLSMSAMTAIDGIFVGHRVGGDGIAAVNICVPILMITNGLGLMIGAGASVVASYHLSQGKEKAARLNITQAFIFGSVCILLASILFLSFQDATATLLGSSAELLPMVKDYLKWFVPGLIFSVWSALGLFVIRLDGSPRYAMMCSLVGALSNIVLDYLFICVFDWGLAGAAAASSLAMFLGGVMALIYICFLAKTMHFEHIKASRNSLRYSIRNIGYQCRIGSSAFVGEMTMSILALVGNYVFMHYLGNEGVGAFGIACYYAPFVFMVGNAISQSAQPIISYNAGLGASARVHEALQASLLTALLCGIMVTAAFVLFPKALVGLFIDPACETAQIAIEGFPYYACAFIFFIVNLSCIGYYQSTEKAGKALAFSLLRGIVFLVPSFIIMPMLLGTKGIWLALGVSECLTFLCICIEHLHRVRTYRRTKKNA